MTGVSVAIIRRAILEASAIAISSKKQNGERERERRPSLQRNLMNKIRLSLYSSLCISGSEELTLCVSPTMSGLCIRVCVSVSFFYGSMQAKKKTKQKGSK